MSNQVQDYELMSWSGMALIQAGIDIRRGVALCESAVRHAGRFATPDMYNNLSRAYLAAKRRRAAFKALEKGAAIDSRHPGICATFSMMGVRRPPVIPFLGRGSFLNRILGRLRSLLLPKKRLGR